MIILRKYNTASVVYFPLIKRDVVDFAVGADYTPVAGDTKLSKDGGAAASATTTPFAVAMGNTALWGLTLNASDLQCAKLVITIGDAATKAVEDQMLLVETFGNASAEHLIDYKDAVRFGMTALPNAAADAAGGLPISDAGGLDMDSIVTKLNTIDDFLDTEIAAILADTNELQTDWVNGGRLDLLIDAIKAKTDQLTFTTANKVDSTADQLGTQAKADVNAEVVDALGTDTNSELSSLPGASPTLKQILMFLYMMARNKMTTTSTQRKLFKDDASTVLGTWAVSDDGTTFTQGEVA